MVQVMRTMTEVSTNETLLHLAQLAKESLEATKSFWETSQEESRLLPLIDIGSQSYIFNLIVAALILHLIGEQEKEANRQFRNLVTLHIRITLLSDVFATAGYAHGRAAIGLLQSLMNNTSPQVITDLGSLHRVGVWENIVLNLGLLSKGIAVKTSVPSSMLGRKSTNRPGMNIPEYNTSINPNELNGDLNQLDETGRTNIPVSPAAPSKPNGPREQNSAALKHLAHGLPSSLSPFFQGIAHYLFSRNLCLIVFLSAMVKMFHARRNLEASQRKQISESSEVVAKVMVNHLSPKKFRELFMPTTWTFN